MRKILFRGQTRRKGEKVWMNSKPVDSNWVYGGIFPGEGDFSVIYTLDDIDSYPVYTNTVGQFTGLVDKNGTKIFEGDIIEGLDYTPEDGGYGVVYFEDGAFEVRGNDCVGTFHENYWGKDFEVIGNIYDNPELLGEEV